MKLSDAPSKIIGITLGEAKLNLIHQGVPPIEAKFALLNKDGTAVGFIEIGHGWSEKTMQALKTFSEALEEDAMQYLFEASQASETSESTKPDDEPPQF